ncbi:nuclear transport factor 2 family protein [Portibacter marinus]|uniref:nuclear transport factor 2 family protein n=1 Tax=Portibacter marinus TaxID=2898660 RepID=UPI001F305863|nr:nuclear transport factor 2 family protein [Portibacter marinus]
MEESEINRQLIIQFYEAFSNHDAEAMVNCYHEDIVFEDPAFGKLVGEEAKSMWKMLIKRAKGNLQINHKNVKADHERGSAEWTARYHYGPKKRKVENHIKAHFTFKDHKIWRHTDYFDISKWSRMALGLPGVILGWTPFLQKKIRSGARKGLEQFMKRD